MEEVGNEGILDGAVEDDGGDLELEPDPMGIAVANDRIRLARPEDKMCSRIFWRIATMKRISMTRIVTMSSCGFALF